MGHQRLSWAEKEALRDAMKPSERAGEMVGAFAIILVALFFYSHQAWSTGFFTSSFGSTEAFFLYGSILLGTLGPLLRSAIGRRNDTRPAEMATSLFWIVGSIWLLTVFPFDFSHFGNALPEFLRFLVSWVSNDIAWVLLLIGTVGGITFPIVSGLLYLKVKKLLALHRLR